MFNKTPFYLFATYIVTFGNSIVLSSASAQITTDGSTNTNLTPTDTGVQIDDGDRAGGNLFHSFGEFSVPNGSEAFFNNASDIVNIFSRVTGGNISNINGLIRANGTANLFLINPAGILFGEGASLQIGGSFYGSTADSILFPDGEFSATNLDNPPLITINAPIGLGFRDNPEPIVNRSFVRNDAGDFVGLSVQPGNTLGLVGGNINFEAGEATAPGGNIFLGSLSEAGEVGINDDGSLSFPEDVERADINLTNAADVDVRGTGGGSITVNARNLSLTAGESSRSFLRAGITADSTSPNATAGDISVNVTENLTLDDSSIGNRVAPFGVGNSGNINIVTDSLFATNGAQVSASTNGIGNAGSVEIIASDTININRDNSDTPTGVFSRVNSDGEGNAGGVTISTANLNLTNGAQVSASTNGIGNAGSVEIIASDTINLDGDNPDTVTGVFSQVNS
ncbi:filamentous hemagglutinin N-terminal domain-containing protein, partial [Hyella patelloides]|uniref:filamentous hemagglutinin N-terminal domain-containing protein n=1 Tax=Hyella patelloides TaxID=1982969 RepID=UPI0011A5FD8F